MVGLLASVKKSVIIYVSTNVKDIFVLIGHFLLIIYSQMEISQFW